MKKTLRRHLLFGSAAIFSVFLAAGCGKKATPGEQAVKEMTSAMEEVTSVRMSLAVDWTPVGESSIAMKTDIEQMKEPMDSHTVLTVTQGRGSTSQELYVIRQKEDLALWSRLKGRPCGMWRSLSPTSCLPRSRY